MTKANCCGNLSETRHNLHRNRLQLTASKTHRFCIWKATFVSTETIALLWCSQLISFKAFSGLFCSSIDSKRILCSVLSDCWVSNSKWKAFGNIVEQALNNNLLIKTPQMKTLSKNWRRQDNRFAAAWVFSFFFSVISSCRKCLV